MVVYYPGDLSVDRGTPIRTRNLAAALSREADVVVETDGDGLGSTVSRTRPDVVYGHTHNALRAVAGLARGPRRFVDLHGDPAVELREDGGSRAAAVRMRAAAAVRMRAVDGFTVVTEALGRRVPRGRPVCVVPGAADLGRFDPARRRPPDGKVRCVYVGNFRAYQGVGDLVEAFGLVDGPDFELWLVGDAPAALAGPRVRVPGAVGYDDVPGVLADADVLVLPRPRSRTAELGFPAKLAEYMAAGRAIVATSVGSHAGVLEHGRTGLLVAPGDPPAMASAIASLADPALRDRLGRAARAYAESRLTWSAAASTVLGFMS